MGKPRRGPMILEHGGAGPTSTSMFAACPVAIGARDYTGAARGDQRTAIANVARCGKAPQSRSRFWQP